MPSAATEAGSSFAEIFEQSLARQEMRAGSLVTAEVLRIDQNFVLVNAGLKSESMIPVAEFLDPSGTLEVQVGDYVQVSIEYLEDGHGETRLSRAKAKRVMTWQLLEKAMKENTIVSGQVTGRVRGGLTVQINGVRAFMPGSLADTRPTKDHAYLDSKDVDVKVVKLDKRRNNVVVSRKAVMEELESTEKSKVMETIKEGDIINGVVKNLTDYGAFVDIGGVVDGLLHITDIAWRRLRHPSEAISVGQEVTAKVLKVDQTKGRVSLGIKQTSANPWEGISRRYPSNTRLFGKVTNITDYGAFVEIEAGVEGLVHLSEMDWINKNVNPAKVVTLGQEVAVMVLEIDEERRRISLGIKQCTPNPWAELAQNYKKGDKITGKVRSITEFGIFISMPGGVDGLVHANDLSWTQSGPDAMRNFRKGQELEAVVLAIDVERERISLGIKQLESDPFSMFVTNHDKHTVLTGTVASVDRRRAFITLAPHVDGVLRAAEFSHERTEEMDAHLKVGDTIEVMIINVDRKLRNISLSVKAMEQARQAQVLQQLADENQTTIGTNIGALLKDRLQERDEILAAENAKKEQADREH